VSLSSPPQPTAASANTKPRMGMVILRSMILFSSGRRCPRHGAGLLHSSPTNSSKCSFVKLSIPKEDAASVIDSPEKRNSSSFPLWKWGFQRLLSRPDPRPTSLIQFWAHSTQDRNLLGSRCSSAPGISRLRLNPPQGHNLAPSRITAAGRRPGNPVVRGRRFVAGSGHHAKSRPVHLSRRRVRRPHPGPCALLDAVVRAGRGRHLRRRQLRAGRRRAAHLLCRAGSDLRALRAGRPGRLRPGPRPADHRRAGPGRSDDGGRRLGP
jgi:hypothetical protein